MSRRRETKETRETRTEQIPIRFSPREREAVERFAAQEHQYPSSFLRRLILKQIEQIADDGRSAETEVLQEQMA